MAENKHASDGIAEDLIRSFVNLLCAEQHIKTRIEKLTSELDSGFYNDSDMLKVSLQIDSFEHELALVAEIRREQMLRLYEMYGAQGDKQEWCTVKHLAIAMYTAFEVYQADQQGESLEQYLAINKLLISAISRFLGFEVTQCASCFADILKAEGCD